MAKIKNNRDINNIALDLKPKRKIERIRLVKKITLIPMKKNGLKYSATLRSTKTTKTVLNINNPNR